jgi:hypothetical protein
MASQSIDPSMATASSTGGRLEAAFTMAQPEAEHGATDIFAAARGSWFEDASAPYSPNWLGPSSPSWGAST